MRVRRVTAHAFGPLVAEMLEFADGMTVVYGPNESAKSSWHGAVYAALCGRRRGRGRADADEQRFAERHRPWDRDEWVVSAEVMLDDGRRVELRQDLGAKVDCHAKDLALGTDYSAEIMNDGTPDAARWLGLDRQSFAATACVAQAQMLDVLDRAGGLQDHLQRAAATAGADSTAAAALACIDRFRRENVGTGHPNAARPLRRAMVETQAARVEVDTATAKHAEYERRLVDLERRRRRRDAAEHALRLHEAVAAAQTARELRGRAEAAAELDALLGGVEPVSAAADEATAQQVVAALSAWAARPRPPDAGGEPADADDADDGDELDLWELARVLALPAPPLDPAVEERAEAARARLAGVERARSRRHVLLIAGLVAALGAAALVVLGELVPAAAVLTLGGLVAAAGSLVRGAGQLRVARGQLEAAQIEAATARRTVQAAAAERAAATARCAQLAVPAEPSALRARARARAGGVVLATRDREWRQEWEQARGRAVEQVLAAARLCGIRATTVEDAVALLQRWEARRAASVSRLERARREWTRLMALLEGRTPAELLEEAVRAEERARRAGAGLALGELATVAGVDDDVVRELRNAAQAAAEDAVRAEGSLGERAAVLPPVGEAEERLVRAQAELARVRELDKTLELTRRFLTDAQERAHRDIAPVLAQTVRRALPELTGGRYTDVIVDPRTLRVQVCGPARRWREADRLSHGTAEQIYLLLRIALAEALVRDHETCPLLLDDVTVHADDNRTARLLDLLRRASDDRQIILFTRQPEVRDWARERLDGSRHAVVELRPVPTT